MQRSRWIFYEGVNLIKKEVMIMDTVYVTSRKQEELVDFLEMHDFIVDLFH